MSPNNNTKTILIEACVDSLAQALRAEALGAARLELCASLDVGGTTPSFSLIEEVIQKVKIPVKVMVRPRGGNYVYSEEEFDDMIRSIRRLKNIGVKEIVTGILNKDKEIDLERMQKISNVSSGMDITFHKAIDDTKVPFKELEQLKKIKNIKSILTSGAALTATAGINNLRRMITLCGDRFQIIVAGKVTKDNLPRLHKEIGATEYHGRLIVGDLNAE